MKWATVGFKRSMIVCSCNVFSDSDVRKVCSSARPRSTGAVYGCLGCSAQCGRCARTIRKIMDEALTGACPVACHCCPAARQHGESDGIAGHSEELAAVPA